MYKSLASNLTRNLYSHQYPQTYFALFAFLKQQIVIYLKPWAHLSSRIGVKVPVCFFPILNYFANIVMVSH